MDHVIHKVDAIVVNDVNIVRVIPTHRPWVNEPERIAAVLEAPIIVVALVYMEVVSTAKAGPVVLVRNATVIAVSSTFTL